MMMNKKKNRLINEVRDRVKHKLECLALGNLRHDVIAVTYDRWEGTYITKCRHCELRRRYKMVDVSRGSLLSEFNNYYL